jgi:hypothetical protein
VQLGRKSLQLGQLAASLAVEARKAFHPGDLNDLIRPSNADVEYRYDVAILSNDVVVAGPCEIEHVG